MYFKIYSNYSLIPFKSTRHNILRLYQTHYQILKVNPNCSRKEIREAFIALSKEYHPDVNKNQQAHKRFQEISIAYKVLSKNNSRRLYDLELPNSAPRYKPDHTFYSNSYTTDDPFKDPIFYANRDKSTDYEYKNRPYYGIRGINRLSNATIVTGCIFLALVGVTLQFLAIMKSFTFHREELIRKSIEAQNHLKEATDAANRNGNLKQVQLLKAKFKISE